METNKNRNPLRYINYKPMWTLLQNRKLLGVCISIIWSHTSYLHDVYIIWPSCVSGQYQSVPTNPSCSFFTKLGSHKASQISPSCSLHEFEMGLNPKLFQTSSHTKLTQPNQVYVHISIQITKFIYSRYINKFMHHRHKQFKQCLKNLLDDSRHRSTRAAYTSASMLSQQPDYGILKARELTWVCIVYI